MSPKKLNQEELFYQISKYNLEYRKAIRELSNKDDIDSILSPLVTLSMQYLENSLKAILQDYFDVMDSADDLKIVTHDCRDLLEKVREKYKKYLKIDAVNNQFIRITEYLDYIESIYGKKTLINARYPIDYKSLEINRKNFEVNQEEFKCRTIVLEYSIRQLIDFYGLENIYQGIMASKNPKVQMQDFMNYCDREFKKSEGTIKKWLIKEIDSSN